MERSKLAFIVGIALLVLQSTHGAELNSEATLSCNGNEFKCVNVTHYQPCTFTERAGQESQFMIDGKILPCAPEVGCNDEDKMGCAFARPVTVPVESKPVKMESIDEVPLKTDVVAEIVAEAPAVKSIAVDTPVDAVPVEVRGVEEIIVEEIAVSSTAKPAEKVVEQAAVVASVEAPAVDSAKSAVAVPAKKRKIAKFSPKRLIKGFRAASWRPHISLESQKEVVDSMRKRIFERRNKYESFVNTVLGKATPVKQTVVPVKQPAPGAPLNDDYDEQEPEEGNEPNEGGDNASPSDECADSSSGCDYDSSNSCDDDDCDDDDDDDDDECDDDEDEDELEPGEGEAVWEEEEVEGGIEIIEECPDEDDDCEGDCCEDECDDDEDYEWEDGVVEESEVSPSDCDDDEDCCDEDCECVEDDEECKKKKKQFAQKNKNKNKKKKKTSNKKKTSSKQSGDNKSSSKNKDKKQSGQKKKVRYPAVQKIRKSLGRSSRAANVTASTRSQGGQGGEKHPIKDIASAIGNGVLNRVDGILSIKDNGLFGNKKQQGDEDTGCTIIEGWECPRLGKYPHPVDCQRYVKCSLKGQNTVFECEEDESYDPDQRQCTTDWSSCDALEQCLYHRQLIEDPSDESGYFICIRDQNKFKETYTLYRRQCTEDRLFDPDYQLCIDGDDYERIKKAKKRRQQIKKQKKCSKRKGNKSGKKKKSQKRH